MSGIRLSVYDLDRTITAVPTWSLFLLFAARRLAPWRLVLVPLLAPVALLRAVRIVDRDRLKEAMHRLLLGTVPADRLARVSEAFADAFVERHVLPLARERMAADRAEGRRIVIATAAHRFYAEPIARRLGCDALVATEARRDVQGRIGHRIEGRNCYADAKRDMLAQWLAKQGIDRTAAHVRFYSDHRSDLPTFEWADEPVAVNAHPPLARLARARGWPVVDWRPAQR